MSGCSRTGFEWIPLTLVNEAPASVLRQIRPARPIARNVVVFAHPIVFITERKPASLLRQVSPPSDVTTMLFKEATRPAPCKRSEKRMSLRFGGPMTGPQVLPPSVVRSSPLSLATNQRPRSTNCNAVLFHIRPSETSVHVRPPSMLRYIVSLLAMTAKAVRWLIIWTSVKERD